jgi:hypothetical protein
MEPVYNRRSLNWAGGEIRATDGIVQKMVESALFSALLCLLSLCFINRFLG